MTLTAPPLHPHRMLDRVLLAIDPGLDKLAVATFVLPPVAPSTRRIGADRPYWLTAPVDEKFKCLAETTSCNTVAAEPLPKRIQKLDHWLLDYLAKVRRIGPLAAVKLEVPRYAGQYRRHSEQTRSAAATAAGVNLLHVAIGATLAVVTRHCDNVETVLAGGAHKDARLRVVELFCQQYGKQRPPNADERDAVSIGIHAAWDL